MAFTRRHLPHWVPEGVAVFVTWRLAGSLPAAIKTDKLTDDKRRSSVLLDDERFDGAGPFWLQDARIASVVANALLYGEQVRKLYRLHAWVIMPNHVHAIFQPHDEMSTIMRWLKGRTGRKANEILGQHWRFSSVT